MSSPTTLPNVDIKAFAKAIKEELGLALGKKLLTTTEAAEYLACTTQHVRNLVSLGILPVVKWPTAEQMKRERSYFDREDLDKAIRENKHNGS